MCGLVGIVTSRAHSLALEPGVLEVMRDRLSHRGPDGAGAWTDDHAALGHRRLAILDPSPAGHQPYMARQDGSVLVYNGELYNDRELRTKLGPAARFRSSCDTETLWHALDRWGTEAPCKLRGMYALAWYDAAKHRLVLARDPLGIKPLYVWEGTLDGVPVIAFASELPALFECPGIEPSPDMLGVSAYLSTIRTVNGSRTMFAGVRSLLPGEVVEFDLSGERPRLIQSDRVRVGQLANDAAFESAFEDSVHRHLRSDVPLCALLSGGLDSSAICASARPHLDSLHTYCAGAQPKDAGDDLASAALVAGHLGTAHTSLELDEQMFVATWETMTNALGVPLSTPNETAIHLLCRAMRRDGKRVTLSGEGADELLGGYEAPMSAAAAHIASGNADPGLFQLTSNSWCPLDLKASVLTPDAFALAEADQWLTDYYRTTFAECAQDATSPLAAHLRFHRTVNLTGLLGRLDSASMLASIEGRTPFADIALAGCAEALPMADRYAREHPLRTKIALRRAFQQRLPASIVDRPKASFPLPFERWMSGPARNAIASDWIRSVISPEALALTTSAPHTHWRLAWPIINLALWGERWWGDGAARSSETVEATV